MNIKRINQDVEEGKNLLSITEAYSEITALKLKKIRDGVRYSRSFFDELSQVYFLVKFMAQKSSKKVPVDKTISIVLTSNEPFYGHITKQTMGFFTSQTEKFPTDRIVIGKSGKEYLAAHKYTSPYKTFLFSSDIPDAFELKNLVDDVKSYSRILVFYSEYQSLIKQIPTIKDITQSESSSLKQAASKLTDHAFIFEPEVLKMLDFFESEIKTALLSQTFLEAELARIASKLVIMDEAQSRAEKFLDTQKVFLSQARREIENRKLLEAWKSIKFRHI
jgi:ATP synthase F1 gamma subunit